MLLQVFSRYQQKEHWMIYFFFWSVQNQCRVPKAARYVCGAYLQRVRLRDVVWALQKKIIVDEGGLGERRCYSCSWSQSCSCSSLSQRQERSRPGWSQQAPAWQAFQTQGLQHLNLSKRPTRQSPAAQARSR